MVCDASLCLLWHRAHDSDGSRGARVGGDDGQTSRQTPPSSREDFLLIHRTSIWYVGLKAPERKYSVRGNSRLFLHVSLPAGLDQKARVC